MSNFKHDILLRIVKVLNVVLAAIPFMAGWLMYYSGRVYADPLYIKGNLAILVLFVILYSSFGRIYDAFFVSLNRISEMIYSQSLSVFFSDGVMYIVLALLIRNIPNLLPLVIIFVLQVILLSVWCVLAHLWYFKTFGAKSTVIVYDEREGMENLIAQYGLAKKFNINAVCDVEECLNDNLKFLKDQQPEAVYLCGIHSHERNIILKYCIANKIDVYVIPRIGDTLMSGARRMHMFHLPVLRVGRFEPTPEYAFIKRLFDIILSFVALIILSPVFLITAIAIVAEDHGPIFYRQTRLTKDGKEFGVIKFRSMQPDAENDGIARLSTGADDKRITKTGRFIRKFRVDELPQLFNILAGDMSIVGPRPERPSIARDYEKELPEFALRLQVRAGLTGYAQVYGKYNTTPYDKLMMDLMYITHASVLEDLRIIVATIKILFMPDSTEGIAGDQTTAMDGRQKRGKSV